MEINWIRWSKKIQQNWTELIYYVIIKYMQKCHIKVKICCNYLSIEKKRGSGNFNSNEIFEDMQHAHDHNFINDSVQQCFLYAIITKTINLSTLWVFNIQRTFLLHALHPLFDCVHTFENWYWCARTKRIERQKWNSMI